VVFTNRAEIAEAIDVLKFADEIPFLHVSSLEGPGRKLSEQLNIALILEFVELVLSHLSQFPEWLEFVAWTRDAMPKGRRHQGRKLPVPLSFHNVSRHSDIGKLSFEQATLPIEKQVAEFLRRVVKRGALRTADPKIAAMHLLSLIESELLQRVLLGVIDSVKPEAVNGAVRRAVDVFLSGYERR
jgi:hypothetical protein